MFNWFGASLFASGCDNSAELAGEWVYEVNEPYVRTSSATSCSGSVTATGTDSTRVDLSIADDHGAAYIFVDKSVGLLTYVDEDCPPEEYTNQTSVEFDGRLKSTLGGPQLVGEAWFSFDDPDEWGHEENHRCHIRGGPFTCEGFGTQVWVFERVEPE